MVTHSHPPEDRQWNLLTETIERNKYAVIYNAISLIRQYCKPHHHWVCDRLLEVVHRAARSEMLLTKLAAKEETYRFVHDCEGDESQLVVGRAWDALRKAGNEARDHLRGGSDEHLHIPGRDE